MLALIYKELHKTWHMSHFSSIKTVGGDVKGPLKSYFFQGYLKLLKLLYKLRKLHKIMRISIYEGYMRLNHRINSLDSLYNAYSHDPIWVLCVSSTYWSPGQRISESVQRRIFKGHFKIPHRCTLCHWAGNPERFHWAPRVNGYLAIQVQY